MSLQKRVYVNVTDMGGYRNGEPFRGMSPDEYCKETYQRMLHLMRVILRDSEYAKDAAQESYLRMWRSRHTYRSCSSFDNWFRRISVNVACEFLRKRRHDERKSSDLPYDPISEKDTAQEFNASIDAQRLKGRLSESDRNVLVYFHEMGMTHREIAHVFGITENTSRTRLFDATRRARVLAFSPCPNKLSA